MMTRYHEVSCLEEGDSILSIDGGVGNLHYQIRGPGDITESVEKTAINKLSISVG